MTQAHPPALRRPPQEARPDRRYAILLAAEKLFAQRGYSGVSIRQIADEAGVPLALVGYYFGPKHTLFRAIFEHWNSAIGERLEALAAVRTHAAEVDYLEQVVAAFVDPVLRLRASAEGEFYALLVARELAHATEEADRVLREFFDPLAQAFIDAIAAAVPGATRAQAAWGYQFALGALLHHLSDTRVARLSGGVATPCDPDAAPLLNAFITGGLRAALAPPPGA